MERNTGIDYYYRSIRDPLYGFIGISKRENLLIDTPIFQRLRNIKQLGKTDLLYPSAVHTRFEHSLGTMHVADIIAQRLQLDSHKREVIRVAVLLHDIGHGPLSHLFENILNMCNNKISHEDITRILLSENSEISSILEGNENLKADGFNDILKDVISLFDVNCKETLLKDILSSSLDADKLDYLRRDSYHVGVAYGLYDFHRIIHTLDHTGDGSDHIAVKEKGKDALESFRIAKYLMHTQVYQHRVRAIVDTMLTRASELAFEEGILYKDDFKIDNREKFLSLFKTLDDYNFLIMLLKSNGDCSKLVKAVLNRNLFKSAYEKDLSEYGFNHFFKQFIMDCKQDEIRKIEEEIAKSTGVNKNFIIIYPQKISHPYYRDPYSMQKETDLLIRINNQVVPIDEVSPFKRVSDKFIPKLYVFCPEEYRDKIGKAMEEYIQKYK